MTFYMLLIPEPSFVSNTQRRACLTLGAIIKTLRQNGNTTLALQLVTKLEEALGNHNESKMNIYRHLLNYMYAC
jgi:hypothetical protein